MATGATRAAQPVDPPFALALLAGEEETLAHWQVLAPSQRELIAARLECWRVSEWLSTGRQVLLHGDANPTDFIFDGRGGITAIDVESSEYGDRAVDIGCMAAELKHLFYLYSHDRWASEPYIRHFYACYAAGLTSSCEHFSELTTRGRYYMGCFLLRICQDAWLDLGLSRCSRESEVDLMVL